MAAKLEHNDVDDLTTLVTSLNSTVLIQATEIKKLKKLNFKLSHAEIKVSNVKAFKTDQRSSSSRPSYKNFRVLSSSSSSDEARRKGENEDDVNEDVVGDDVDDNDFDVVDKGKGVMNEEENDQNVQILETPVDNENEETNNELEDEYTKRNLIEMQTATMLAEKERYEKEMAKKAA
ncbi:hypothetical protein L1987_43923 [Smallanthus sonchifolius]|uniref:Uncharacterized protein n=1 Tax=Smallanthus sonchifolius TaxID=185202 RepID=A0ACB9GP33_9ASTR|nr:hypothetical protein L1987_43923 [Smallanthus sonchifolius]